MKEEILIDVKLDGGENEKRIDALTESLTGLTKANKELAEEQKKLEQAGQTSSKQYLDNAKSIEINKQKIKENSAERTGLIKTIIAEDNSVKALQIRNAELIKQRNLINTSTSEGKSRISAINKEIDKNNAVIKDNVSGLEKQKINIGNYASALDGIKPGLGAFVNGLESSIKSAKAFIATPLGMVLGALGLALGALTAFFKGSEEGQDKLTKAMNIGKVVFQQLTQVAEKLGEVLFTAIEFIGDVATKIINTVAPTVGKALQDSIDAANKITELDDRIEARENQMIVNRAATNKKVQELREKAITQEGEAKRKTIEEAIRLEKELSAQEAEQLNDRLRLIDLEIASRGRATEEEKKQRAEALAAVINAEAEGAQSTIRFQKEIERIRDEARAKENKARDEDLQLEKLRLESLREIQEEDLQAQRNSLDSFSKEWLAKKEEDVTESFEVEEDVAEKTENIYDNATQKRMDEALKVHKLKQQLMRQGLSEQQADLKIHRMVEAQRVQVTQQALYNISQLLGQKTKAAKAVGIAQATINTYEGATSAYAAALKAFPAPYSYIIAPIAAGIAIAAGLANVAHIAGIQFARGGILQGRAHSEGGIPFSVNGKGGFEAEGGEAIINKKSTRMFRSQLSAINEAGGGVRFATGGIVTNETRASAQAARSQTDFNRIVDTINQTQIVLIREDFERKQMQHIDTERLARVI